ncbi:MAG: replication initiator protein [Microvirus sp.]|nr:MAG: replication initiator protein [Microvirus sp.]
MPCTSPLAAFALAGGGISFRERGDITGDIKLPCGQCTSCRLARASAWSLRLMHEATDHDESCFLTLTYDDAHLPPRGSLQYRDVQLFLKRLRKHIHPKPLRYYLCGEYGDQLSRPHYHICLFGHNFKDISPLAKTQSNAIIYESPSLKSLWPLGLHSVGKLTKQSAGYTARYVMKKITGQQAETHYERLDPETGELYRLAPEFNRMSTRPGIGASWYNRFSTDVHVHDHLIHDGSRHPVPKYYDKLFKRKDPSTLGEIKALRELKALPHKHDQTPARLAVKDEVIKAKTRTLKRTI